MSHIHLPDGILPVWLWLSGYIASALLIGILWRWGRATADPRKFALLGIFAAIMVLVAMVEIPPFAYHFNLSVAAGIILGPRLSVVAALMVNVVLSLIGHGGITVVGLNTLVLSAEMIVGYYVFRWLIARRATLGRAGFAATAIGLAAGTGTAYGLIAAGASWINRSLRLASLGPDRELGPGIEGASLDTARLALIMFGIGLIGWILEGILTVAALGYINRVYPDLTGDGETE